jgi:hypothetical protein
LPYDRARASTAGGRARRADDEEEEGVAKLGAEAALLALERAAAFSDASRCPRRLWWRKRPSTRCVVGWSLKSKHR